MYILAATFKNVEETQYFVARTRKALLSIMRDATDWRLHDGDGWCAGKTENAWKISNTVVGQLCRYVI